MKVQLIIPNWSIPMPWVKIIGDIAKDLNHKFVISDKLVRDADAYIFGWMDQNTVRVLKENDGFKVPVIAFMRRYEFFNGWWKEAVWTKKSRLIFVNDFFYNTFLKNSPHMRDNTMLLYNPVNYLDWSYNIDRGHGKKIAMVGNLNARKNIPMALQILSRMREHELHLSGNIQSAEVLWYLENVAKSMQLKIYHHGHIPHENINSWLDGMDYLLNCSLSEGNPNSVLEALAKGMKVAVHNWPGARDQFPEDMVFDTVDQAVEMFDEKSDYPRERNRDLAKTKFSVENMCEIFSIIELLSCKKE